MKRFASTFLLKGSVVRAMSLSSSGLNQIESLIQSGLIKSQPGIEYDCSGGGLSLYKTAGDPKQINA